MPQNRRGNGNIYDLRRDLRRDPQRPAAPSQQSGTPAGSADGRYGFNGEPLSFKPDRTASGAPRRTRTDNSIAFPTQPRTRAAAPSAPGRHLPGRTGSRHSGRRTRKSGRPRAQRMPRSSATRTSACARPSKTGTPSGGRSAKSAR